MIKVQVYTIRKSSECDFVSSVYSKTQTSIIVIFSNNLIISHYGNANL